MLSWKFLNWKQAQKRVNNCSKKIRKGEKGKAKKFKKLKSLKMRVKNLEILISAHTWSKLSKSNASGKEGMHAVMLYLNAFLCRLELNLAHIQAENVQKSEFCQKVQGVNVLNFPTCTKLLERICFLKVDIFRCCSNTFPIPKHMGPKALFYKVKVKNS